MKRLKLLVIGIALVATLALMAAGAVGQELRGAGSKVYLVPVDGTVEYGLSAFVARAVREAEGEGAAAIVFDIDTPGGLVDAALRIRDSIVKAKVKTVAYVNPRAWSAGALLAIACDTLAMHPGGSMGAAETRPNEEKYISAVRAEFAATAGMRGRDANIAAAMVDADVEIPGLVDKGKILTLTAAKATELGFADLSASSVRELLEKLDLAGAQVVNAETTMAERAARMLTNDVVSQVLLTLGLLGIAVELLTPGFGIPGVVGLTALGLFFGGRLIGGMAGWEVVGLFFLGFVLLLIELFLIPGFGIAGILGILAIFASLILSFPTPAQAMRALSISIVAVVAIAVLVVRYLARAGKGGKAGPVGRLVLHHSETPDRGYLAVDRLFDLEGAQGVAVTGLKPVGIVEIRGRRVEAMSEGDFVEAGTKVRVVRVEANNVFVRGIHNEDMEG